MREINPIEIKGIWDKGFSIDKHSIKSDYIGDDPFGRQRFATERTLIGQYMYELKYRGNNNRIEDIINLIIPFLDGWEELAEVDVVFPIPPSNTKRITQPVFGIARAVAEHLNKHYVDSIIIKINNLELKNIEYIDKNKLENTITLSKFAKRKYSALIIDDIYDTGKTLNDAVTALKTDPNLLKVYVLTMTKKR